MVKYMKYELRGTYRFMLAIILVVLVATSGIQVYSNSSVNTTTNTMSEPSVAGGIFIALMGFVVFGAFIVTLFYLIGNFRKELYEDRGYLTFTLPLSGNQILGAKTIIALMWTALLVISFVVYNILLARILYGEVVSQIINDGIRFITSLNLKEALIAYFLLFILSVITTLLFIYFSIALSRVTVGSKKIGGIWIIIFLVFNSLISFLGIKVAEIIPYYLDVSNFRIIGESEFLGYVNSIGNYIVGPGAGSQVIISTSEIFGLNIGYILFNILITIGIFLGTGYLVEKKVDL